MAVIDVCHAPHLARPDGRLLDICRVRQGPIHFVRPLTPAGFVVSVDFFGFLPGLSDVGGGLTGSHNAGLHSQLIHVTCACDDAASSDAHKMTRNGFIG